MCNVVSVVANVLVINMIVLIINMNVLIIDTNVLIVNTNVLIINTNVLITNMCVLSKLFERVLLPRLYRFCVANEIVMVNSRQARLMHRVSITSLP